MGEWLIHRDLPRSEIQKDDTTPGTFVCQEGSTANAVLLKLGRGRDSYGRPSRPGIVPAENWSCPHSMSWNCVDPVRCPTKD
jgi:hypothetical protein